MHFPLKQTIIQLKSVEPIKSYSDFSKSIFINLVHCQLGKTYFERLDGKFSSWEVSVY
jgi:hypothetical protein